MILDRSSLLEGIALAVSDICGFTPWRRGAASRVVTPAEALALGRSTFIQDDVAFMQHMIVHHEAGRPLVILAGIESHVCVMQTAADLSAAGFGVFAVADAMASRVPSSHALAVERMRQHGVAVVNTEMVVFELLGRAGTAEFKALSSLVR